MAIDTTVRAFDLTDRVAVITGAGGGLGRAMAQGMAAFGAHIVIAEIDEPGAQETARMIEKSGRRSLAWRCDIGNAEDVARLFREVDDIFGRVDILVNNAGLGSPRMRPEELRLDQWNRIMETNLTGCFLCCQEAARRMITQQKGSIINISSIGGATALGRGNTAYSISKGAILQLTRDFAVEWAKHNIRVNALLPCQFRTPALQVLIDDPQFDSDTLLERFVTGIPMNRIGEPEDMVGPAVFLASDAAAMVTGALLPVDGGNLALNAGGNHTW